MRTEKKTIGGASKNILRVGTHFVNLPVKVDPATLVADGDGRKILAAGTILSKTGTIVNDGTAYGLVYEDWDFTNRDKEAVPVVVHGFIELAQLPVAPDATAIAALKQILFV